eukprot:g2196.t1
MEPLQKQIAQLELELREANRHLQRQKSVIKRLGQDARIEAHDLPPPLEDDDFFLHPPNNSKVAKAVLGRGVLGTLGDHEDEAASAKNAPGKKKSYSRPPPLFRASDYEQVRGVEVGVGGDGAAGELGSLAATEGPAAAICTGGCELQIQVKKEINEFLAQAVAEQFSSKADGIKISNSDSCRSCDSLGKWMAEDWRNIVLAIDSPELNTSRTLLNHNRARTSEKKGIAEGEDDPGVAAAARPSQIHVPQYDQRHYLKMIHAHHDANGLKRLDHWLICNRGLGYQCALFFADMEGNLVGHKEKRLCPAKDVMRWFRYGYARRGGEISVEVDDGNYSHYPAVSVLAVTLDLRDGRFGVADLVDFVVEEGRVNNYEVNVLKEWSYGMGCVAFEVKDALCHRKKY